MFMQKEKKKEEEEEEEEERRERSRKQLTAVHYYQNKYYHAPVITFEAHFPLSHLLLHSVALSILTSSCLPNSFSLFFFQAPPEGC
jgi:hypothetical protein